MMKVDKLEFKRIVNEAAHLAFHYSQIKDTDDININNDELEYLISNNIHHKVINASKKSLFGDKVILQASAEKDYVLLKKYIDYFRE
ncbi:hypothetical protein [Candidatus Enterococcus willemsii]|nr:hypothetical protein [Enterococcus sp. CU12B]